MIYGPAMPKRTPLKETARETIFASKKKAAWFSIFIITSSLFSIPSSSAAVGSLDTSFDTDGIVTTTIQSRASEANSIAVQSDGKIVAAGFSYDGVKNNFAVVRYNTDGSLDTSFDTDGQVITAFGSRDSFANSIAVQSDGKIVAAGSSYDGVKYNFAVVRYNTDGSLDTSFDTDGIVTTTTGSRNNYANSIAVQSDGKIVAAGYAYDGVKNNFAVVRYNTDGSLDTSFDTDGIVTTTIQSRASEANSIAVQSDGKIVAAGYAYDGVKNNFAVVRYNTDGSLDTSFDTDGQVITAFGSGHSFAYSIAVQSDGKIVAAGSSYDGVKNNFAVVRYLASDSTAPAAPTLNSVASGDRRVTVSFTAGANNGAAITDYEYSLNGGAYTSAGTTTSPFTITGLSGRATYSVAIKARNSGGLSTASSLLTATTTDASRDASEAAAEVARLAAIEAARVAAVNAEATKKAKEQKELTELLSLIPSLAGLSLNLGDLANSLLTTTCVKGKAVKNVKKGAKCPKGYVKTK
jgi:uncharacterized delta-60 repeat protein